MAAYSAVTVFRQTLEQLLDSDQFPPHVSKTQIVSLHENVCSLQSSLDKIPFAPKVKREKMKDLQNRIREAIYAAQDEVDYWIRGNSPHGSDENTMKKLEEDIKLVEKDAVEMERETRNDGDLFRESSPQPRFNFSSKDKIVGQEEDFKVVSERLESGEKARVVIPITGLPGIGKTALVRSIYDDIETRKQFNIRAWITVSQDVNYQEMFSNILSSMESKNYRAGHYAFVADEQILLLRLYQELSNLRFLIVVDDVWDTNVWGRLEMAFPDNKNGSRILLTTRILEVARSVSRYGFIHHMKPLGPEHSWELLCYRVFGDKLEDYEDDITKACPAHLKDIGRRIAEKCNGLPLSIMVVGGLLLQERANLEYWKRIEEDTVGAAAVGDDSYMEILSLSYNNMPAYLKPCFLYMVAFPEEAGIRVSKLIKLWVAEGFFPKPSLPTQTMELVAHKALEDLIDRNLISISEKSSNGGIKVCWMHDILREMAEIEARKEKFFHCRKKYDQGLEEGTKFQRRVSVHKNLLMSLEDVYETTKTITSARTLLYVGPHHHHPLPFCLTFDLLRVLDAFTVYFVEFPDEFLQLVHLTYLSLTYNDEIPPEISLLQKLQVLMVQRKPKLIFVGVSFLPDEIWEMPELRHLWFTETDFPPLPSAPRGDIYMLFNLQTLASVNAAYFTDEILGNIPNLRKLAMWIEVPDKIGFNVAKLSKLEHFKLIVLKPIPGKGIEVEAENFFPRTLKRVTLSGTGLPWEYMEFLAKELKDLQVLKLKEVAFHGDEWCPDYEFKQLKYLLIEYLHFKTWEATYEIFPRLQRLIVRHCYELEEIPQDIGYVGALEMMELVDCSPQAVDSAEQIIDEQKNFGNNGFEESQVTEHDINGDMAEPCPTPTTETIQSEEEPAPVDELENQSEVDTVRKLRPRRAIKQPERYQDFVSK
ncbi:putative late blight resistance protein homolog R1A-3 [Salvia splendens]|uniref:putative late blight resistance protein homolog R1A-3 n=1 Tax=Salvia splendens TaxID=180675 RepID=UPI001C26270E|nr:putative late blight resistance protein homolog R1A-3 [Salvia splendens]